LGVGWGGRERNKTTGERYITNNKKAITDLTQIRQVNAKGEGLGVLMNRGKFKLVSRHKIEIKEKERGTTSGDVEEQIKTREESKPTPCPPVNSERNSREKGKEDGNKSRLPRGCREGSYSEGGGSFGHGWGWVKMVNTHPPLMFGHQKSDSGLAVLLRQEHWGRPGKKGSTSVFQARLY